MTKRVPGAKMGRPPFVPSDPQRAYVAASAGVGVPHAVICQHLPGAKAGDEVAIDRETLEKHFAEELRNGMQLALSRVAARVFHRALFGDEKNYATHRAAEMILVTRGGWKKLGEGDPSAETPLQADEDFGDVKRLTREERKQVLELLAKTIS
jgi:hypothetical protein